MKKSIFSLLFVAMGVFAFASSTILSTDTETRNLGDFSKVSVSAGIHLILVPSNTNKAMIEVEDIDIDEVITEIKGNKLVIKIDKKNWKWGWKSKRKVTVTLDYEDISGVSASSGSKVTSDESLKNENLDLSTSSGASMNLDIESDDVDASSSSGATLRLSGATRTFDAKVSSGASIKASDLKAEKVDASASSGAGVRVWVTERLEARASSGGSVKYKGSPHDIDKSKSSGGSIRKL